MVNKEFDSSSNQAFDRKPVRRRMARDIYFVFEEGKKNYSKMRGYSKDKSKFGHLKVGEIQKSGVYASKNFYSVKNKRKCFVNASYTLDHKACYSHSSPIQFPASHLPIAKVNPIFLWVKQDDTTIVEVRCEDYDKRNRIRLTKTLNGWRATPRTDPTSSRVVKLSQKNFRKVTLGPLSENKDKIPLSLPKNQQKCNNSKEHDKEEKRNQTNFVSNESNSDQSDEIIYSNKTNTHFSKNLDLKLTLEETAESARTPEISEMIANNNLNTDKNNLYTSETSELQLCPETGLFISKDRSDFEAEYLKINDIIIDLEDSDALSLKTQTETVQDGKTNMFNDILDDSNLLQKSSCNDSNGSESINSFVRNNFFEPSYSTDASSGSDLIKSFIKENCYNNSMECYDKVNENLDEISEITKNLLQQESDSDILTHIRNSIPASPNYDNISESGPIKSLDVDLFQTEISKCLDEDEAVEIADIKVGLIKNGVSAGSTLKDGSEIESLNVNLFHNDVLECNSFSETAELEDLNVDLFQNGSLVDVNKGKKLRISNESLYLPNIVTDHSKYHIATNASSSNYADECPEDLSYRKVDRICALSDTQKNYSNIPSNLFKSLSNSGDIFESTSKTITNIFKEITKLAPFNDHQKNQTEAVNLEKNKSNYSNDICSNCCETSAGDILVEEPIQKRVRSSFNNHELHNNLRIKNDPDPLTQLKILIHNSQWKLPDPILVPRELLGAILESPAREIPLLLSSRPELKLPEAFSYPEILKNPNILVISIAQLEAILRAEMESKLRNNDAKKEINNNSFLSRHQEEKRKKKPESLEGYDISNYNHTESMNYNKINSCLESNLNAARLALLNKMLLVPYSYGRLSSDMLQLVDEETVGRKNASDSYFLSLHNQELPKAASKEVYDNNINVPMNLNQKDHISARLDNPNRKRELLPTIELPMLEEILQSKMHRLHSINKIISELDQNIISSSNKPFLNQKTFALLTSHKDLRFLNEPIVKSKSISNVASCNSVNNSPIVNSKNNNSDLSNITLYKNLRNHQKSIDYKPKLTCKSLSNLIYPENIKHSTVPLVNLITSNDEFFYKYGDIHHENIKDHIEIHSSPTSVSTKCTHTKANPVAAEKTDSNASLWHPLFGGNNKNGYCSPWQWTTITSPGE